MSNKVAIDIGYGFTKVKVAENEFKFPTAVSISKTQMVENTNALLFEGKKYLVGEDGLRDAITTRDYSFIYKYAPLLIYAALVQAGVDLKSDLNISTGLSLYDLEKAPEFDFKFLNRKEEFHHRVNSFVINDTQYNYDIKLFAQGQGIWHNYCLKNGFLDKGYEVVVDIGYRTNDILIFKDGVPEKSDSNADDKGVNVIVSELRRNLNKKYDITLTEQEVAIILKEKEIEIYGAKKDLSVILTDIVDGYIESLMSSLKSDYGTLLKAAKRVIISGGGAYILKEYVDAFPQNVVFDADEEFEYENVRGYYNG